MELNNIIFVFIYYTVNCSALNENTRCNYNLRLIEFPFFFSFINKNNFCHNIVKITI